MDTQELQQKIDAAPQVWELTDRRELEGLIQNTTLLKVLSIVRAGAANYQVQVFQADFGNQEGLMKAVEARGVAKGLLQAIDLFATMLTHEVKGDEDGPRDAE